MQTQNPIVDKMLSRIESECTSVDIDNAFNDMLDECYSFDCVGGIFASMSPSRVLKECDPVAYRCGCNDWADSERLVEINGESYRPDDVDEAKEQFIDELNDELSTLESDLEELEADEDHNLTEERAKRTEINDKEAEIQACKEYQF